MRDVLPHIHEGVGLLFVIAAATAFVWAWTLSRRHKPLPKAYWSFIRVGVGGLFGLQILLGLSLLALGFHVPTPLHWLYVVLLILGVGAGEMLRPGSGMRQMVAGGGPFDETRTYWILMLFVAVIALRAWTTGLFGF